MVNVFQDKTKPFMPAVVNYFRKYPFVIPVIIIFILGVLFVGNRTTEEKKLLEKQGIYTLGTVTDVKGTRNGRISYLNFVYEGKEFETAASFGTVPFSWKGERVLIKFLPTNPANCGIVDRNVPDSLLLLSNPIWTTSPYTVSSNSGE